MAKENKKAKTPEQIATERLRKRGRTLISKVVSFRHDCRYHVHLLVINEADPMKQFEFNTFSQANYPPLAQPDKLSKLVLNPDLEKGILSRSHSPAAIGSDAQSMSASPHRNTDSIDWEKINPPTLERSPVELGRPDHSWEKASGGQTA